MEAGKEKGERRKDAVYVGIDTLDGFRWRCIDEIVGQEAFESLELGKKWWTDMVEEWIVGGCCWVVQRAQ